MLKWKAATPGTCPSTKESPLDLTARAFANVLIEAKVFMQGDFELTDGSHSSFYINFGAICRPSHLSILGHCFATQIIQSGIKLDVVYGPAYKAIAMATETAKALWQGYGLDIPFASSRREKRSHGMKNPHLGAPLQDKKVVVVDDVATGGDSKLDACEYVMDKGGTVTGFIIGVDRTHNPAVLEQLTAKTGAPVFVIMQLEDLQQIAAQHVA